MGKGTPSLGKHGKKPLHTRCRRCGRRSYSIREKRCAACGFGVSTRIKQYSWRTKKVSRERIF